MHAIIETGGKQYRLKKGDVVHVEKLNVSDGDEVVFKEVLLLGDSKGVKVGTPHVDGALVKGKVKCTSKDEKKTIFKYKRRKNCHVKKGHRQSYSCVEITDIEG